MGGAISTAVAVQSLETVLNTRISQKCPTTNLNQSIISGPVIFEGSSNCSFTFENRGQLDSECTYDSVIQETIDTIQEQRAESESGGFLQFSASVTEARIHDEVNNVFEQECGRVTANQEINIESVEAIDSDNCTAQFLNALDSKTKCALNTMVDILTDHQLGQDASSATIISDQVKWIAAIIAVVVIVLGALVYQLENIAIEGEQSVASMFTSWPFIIGVIVIIGLLMWWWTRPDPNNAPSNN